MRWFSHISLAGVARMTESARLLALPLALALFGPMPAHALTPDAFQGTWLVKRMVGASNVGTNADYRKVLGTRVEWNAAQVKDADGVCEIVHATVAPISNDILEHSIWGGQTIAGLSLPRSETASAFGKSQTPVYDDGGKQCASAVMLKPNRILFVFRNGYLYLLERAGPA